MDSHTFKDNSEELIRYIINYMENLGETRVYQTVQPGYLKKLLPSEPPESGEDFQSIMKDFQTHVMSGAVHWQSPHFHAYFPGSTSYPSILGEMLMAGTNPIGFTWASNPAGTELEVLVLEWMAKLLKLPKEFHSDKAGAIIQSSASDAMLVAILCARSYMTEKMMKIHPDEDEYSLLPKFVAYRSDQTHSAFSKGCKIAMIQCRTLETNEEDQLRGETLEKMVLEDKKKGLIPLILCGTLGTTSTCAFDKLTELGPICQEHDIWLHVDAAYAGPAFICPEYRPLLDGVEFAESFNFNCTKLMLINFDSSPMWFKDKSKVLKTFKSNFVMFEKNVDDAKVDFKDMQIPLGRRFRAMKIWFVLRSYGVKGLQDHIYKQFRLSKYFSELLKTDDRFEPLGCRLGLTIYRLKGSNSLNNAFGKRVNEDGRIHMTTTFVKDKSIQRFVITSLQTSESSIQRSFKILQEVATNVLRDHDEDAAKDLSCGSMY